MNKNLSLLLGEYKHKLSIEKEKEILKKLEGIEKKGLEERKKILLALFSSIEKDGKIQQQDLFLYKRDLKLKKDLLEVEKNLYKEKKLVINSSLEQGIEEEFYYMYFVLNALLGEKAKKIKEKDKEEILKENWSGEHYNDTLKRHTVEQVDNLFKKVALGSLAGIGLRELNKEIKKVSETGVRKSLLLFQTENTRKSGRAGVLIDDYVEEKLEGWKWVAAFDERTCDICGKLDGKVFKKNEFPTYPAHPRCRCAKIPAVFDSGLIKRRAKNPNRLESYLTDKQTFLEWKKGLRF